MNKQNIGFVVILAGIAFMGFIWFKRNKPSTSENQLKDLTSNLQTGIDNNAIDKTFGYDTQVTNPTWINGNPNQEPPKLGDRDFGLYIDDQVKKSIFGEGTILGDGTVKIDFSNLDMLKNFDFTKVNWSNIKI